MKFFKRFKKDNNIYSPVAGKTVLLEEVADKMFSSKMLGDGIAFNLSGDTVYAPCDGKIVMVANTLHAFGIKLDNGAEILVHIGLDTVNLGGRGFTALKKQGAAVRRGEPVIRIDREVMDKEDIDLTIPVIVTNGDNYNYQILIGGDISVREGADKIISFI